MVVYADVRLATLVENFEGRVLDVGLNLNIIFATNKSFCIEDAR